MTATKKLTKGFALLIVLALVIAIMPFSAQATFTYNNFTKSPATAYNYHYFIGDTNTITLQVGPADDYWYFVGFASEAEAANTNVSWTIDSKLSLVSQGPVEYSAGVWVNQVVLELAGTAWGAAAVTATWTANNASYPMSFTVNIDPATTQAAITGIVVDVYAPATVQGTTPYVAWHTKTATGISVTPLADALASIPQGFVAIQNYSTPLAALVEMIDDGPYNQVLSDIDYGNDGSYLSAIEAFIDSDYNTQLRSAYGYEGWRYCVYRNDSKLDVSESINANAFALVNGDVVVWRYCDYNYSFPSTYTAYSASIPN